MLAAWAGFYLVMASHESGHLLAALATGGRIDRLDLSPIGLSQTHLAHNPRTLVVAWAGPVVGVLDPLLAWLLVVWMRRRSQPIVEEPVITFLAGMCLIANGAYLGLGWIDRIGDAGQMMRLGTPIALMIGVGIVCVAIGLLLWHRMGNGLRLSQLTGKNTRRLIVGSLFILAAGFTLEIVLKFAQ